tara:strand:- start:22856 stop:23248 length:393 start_codon:yes stop_codon:yes gene_type:complete
VGHEYKDKYVSIKDIFKSIKGKFSKKISYKTYYSIITKFFEITIRDVVERSRQVVLPKKLGYLTLEEKLHTRAFHIRVDNHATKEKGETVFFKVPILNDYYKKLMWIRPPKYRHCKVLPLSYAKKIINKN